METIKVMRAAWQDYTSHTARLLVGTAALLVVLVLLALFAFVPVLGLFVFRDPLAIFASLSLSSLFALIAIGVAGVFVGGYIRFAAQAHGRGNTRPDIAALFLAARGGGPSALLFYAYAAALALMVGVPYFCANSLDSLYFSLPLAAVFMFFTSFAPCAAALDDALPRVAWAESFEMAVKKFWKLLWLYVALGAIALVLTLIPVVGPVLLFMLAPWMALCKIHAYNA